MVGFELKIWELSKCALNIVANQVRIVLVLSLTFLIDYLLILNQSILMTLITVYCELSPAIRKTTLFVSFGARTAFACIENLPIIVHLFLRSSLLKRTPIHLQVKRRYTIELINLFYVFFAKDFFSDRFIWQTISSHLVSCWKERSALSEPDSRSSNSVS